MHDELKNRLARLIDRQVQAQMAPIIASQSAVCDQLEKRATEIERKREALANACKQTETADEYR
jgi:hypothetical protein